MVVEVFEVFDIESFVSLICAGWCVGQYNFSSHNCLTVGEMYGAMKIGVACGARCAT